jgi:hypothetical protein
MPLFIKVLGTRHALNTCDLCVEANRLRIVSADSMLAGFCLAGIGAINRKVKLEW